MLGTVRNLSPSLLRQVSPLVEQLAALMLEVSQGRQEFTPAPEETRTLVRSYYSESGLGTQSTTCLNQNHGGAT